MNSNYSDNSKRSPSVLPGFLILTAFVSVWVLMKHTLPLAGFENELQDNIGIIAQIIVFVMLVVNYIYNIKSSRIISRFGLSIAGVIELGLAIFVFRRLTADTTGSLAISPEFFIMVSLLIAGLLSMLSPIVYNIQVARYRLNMLAGGASGIILGLGLFLPHGYMAINKPLPFIDTMTLYILSAAGLFVAVVALSSFNRDGFRQPKSAV